MSRRPLMAGNWKMTLNHHEAIALVQKISHGLGDDDLQAVEVAVLVPFTDIRSVQTTIDADKIEIGYGAQDLSVHDKGAYTGEISGAMLAKLGCRFVAVGHSERRQYHHEIDEVVLAKVTAALKHGLTPIMCIGEPLNIRQAGEHIPYTLAQIDNGLAGLSAEEVSKVVFAYEPIWAIGTGEVATPEDAQEACSAIRERLRELHGDDVADAARILYGGSVKANNVAALMTKPDVDGGLVGGASIDADEWIAICKFPKHPAQA
jgi:triosephosphate isomerase (TIM)